MNWFRFVATGFRQTQPLTDIRGAEAPIVTQDLVLNFSARAAWERMRGTRERIPRAAFRLPGVSPMPSDVFNTTTRCVLTSRIESVTSPGQARINATLCRINWSRFLAVPSRSASAALCLTRTGMEPKRSRTVTRVPLGKVSTRCSGIAGTLRDTILELWMVKAL